MRRMKRPSHVVLFTSFLGVAPALSAPSEVPPAVRAAAKDPAGQLGKIDFPVTGSASAKAHFQRGVLALHSFWYDEALDQFRASTRAEPGFLMGYWGEAMALNHPVWQEQDTAGGQKVLAVLDKWVDPARSTPRERAYVEALRALYSDREAHRVSKAARDQAYAVAMERLHRAYPQDLEAAAFYALALLGGVSPEDSGLHARMQTAAVALDILAKNPRHPGAAHYIIHAFDDPDHAALGLPAARRYSDIAPEAAHARHMPSHIFVQLGMWPEAAAANESSIAAARTVAARRGAELGGDFYHAQGWLVAIQLERGQKAQARQGVQSVAEALSKSQETRWWIAYLDVVLAYLLETGEWQATEELLAPLKGVPAEAALSPGKPIGAAVPAAGLSKGDKGTAPTAGPACGVHAAAGPAREGLLRGMLAAGVRGLSSAARGDAAAAKARAQELRALRRQFSGGDPNIPTKMEILELYVTAAAAQAQGNIPSALTDLRRAVTLEEKLPPPSGPAFALSSHERLGELLLRSGKQKEASAEFARAIYVHPGRTRSLLGAARSAAQGYDPGAAAEIYQKLVVAWDQADAAWPGLTEARSQAGSPSK